MDRRARGGERLKDAAMDPDAELDAIVEQVEAAGLVEQYVDEQGRPAMRLTPEGVRVARQLMMLGEDGQDELMAGLLGPEDSRERRCNVERGRVYRPPTGSERYPQVLTLGRWKASEARALRRALRRDAHHS